MNAFLSKTARDVVELSSRNWWNEVYENTPVIELVKLLSSPNLHRVAVLNEQKKVCNIVSQMDLLVFIYNNRENFPLLREPVSTWNKERTVESIEWNSALAEGKGVHCKTDAKLAFKKIWESEVTGIAVLDDDGKLVGNISASDLKVIFATISV